MTPVITTKDSCIADFHCYSMVFVEAFKNGSCMSRDCGMPLFSGASSMMDEIDIDTARAFFAHAIEGSEFIPDSAEIEIGAEPALGNAAVFHCRWPLVEKGPLSEKFSREITVQVNASAMNRFRAADPRDQGAMLARFRRLFNARLIDLHYDENDPPSPPFIVHVDENSLAP
jgi:hypothetical protein